MKLYRNVKNRGVSPSPSFLGLLERWKPTDTAASIQQAPAIRPCAIVLHFIHIKYNKITIYKGFSFVSSSNSLKISHVLQFDTYGR